MTWLDKLAENIERLAGKAAKEKVMAGSEKVASASNALERAKWIGEAMKRLDELVDYEKRRRIMIGCSDKFPKTRIRLLRSEYRRLGSVDRLLEIMSKDNSWFGLSFYEYPTREGNVIHVTKIPYDPIKYQAATNATEKRYNYCHCALVKELTKIPDYKISPTYCCCGAGWYDSLWEGILGKPVRVEVVQSVLRGDDCCKFAIHLPQGL
jgi:hypothetical protein